MTPEQLTISLVGTAATIVAWLICAAALAWDYLL